MKFAIILIATGGEKYLRYATPLIQSLFLFLPSHDVILFTDSKEPFDAIKVHQPSLGWPRATLMRYHAMLKQRELLLQYEQVFYMDIDMRVCSKIDLGDIVSKGITAVIHPGYPGSFERRRESTAFVEGNPPYYQGCFVGGDTRTFLEMCEVITKNIDADNDKGIVAVWHDESHLNRYLSEHPPAKVLPPSYCYPENYVIKILHRAKGNEDRPSVTELCELARKWRTDKVYTSGHHSHDYTPFYHSLLKEKRSTIRRVLEIGIGYPELMRNVDDYLTGASLFMWREYFPSAEIYACDIKSDILINEERIHSFYCDQGSEDSLRNLISQIGNLEQGFDLIVDDGSHVPNHQILSAKILVPFLSPSGVYVIEDVISPELLVSQLPYKCEIRQFNLDIIDDKMVVIQASKQ